MGPARLLFCTRSRNRLKISEFLELDRNLAGKRSRRRKIKTRRTHLISRNGCVAGDLALRQGARRENILYGSLSDEQRRCSPESFRGYSSVIPTRRDGYAPLSRLAPDVSGPELRAGSPSL